mmetsp:Transcript_32454/g.82871  ORF Transcript_32454/g.82871 Transcript_32454/m.82871 type:complete len:207 (-) Transcript_32454:317-937(-)
MHAKPSKAPVQHIRDAHSITVRENRRTRRRHHHITHSVPVHIVQTSNNRPSKVPRLVPADPEANQTVLCSLIHNTGVVRKPRSNKRKFNNRREGAEPKVHTRKRCPHAPRTVPTRRKVTIPKLPIPVSAPAHGSPVAQKGTSVPLTSRHTHRSPSAEINTRKIVPHLTRPVTTSNRVSKAKLTMRIVSPALDACVIKHHTAVIVPA